MTSSWLCPVPAAHLPDRISLAHGEGARLSRQLLQEFILPLLSGGNPQDNSPPPICDAAVLSTAGHIAFCTDAHTITPLHFPGGDLGSLAVIGTVNDLDHSGYPGLNQADTGFPAGSKLLKRKSRLDDLREEHRGQLAATVD